MHSKRTFMKKNLTSYAYFSPGERRSLLLLATLAVVLFAFPAHWLPAREEPALSAEDQAWVEQQLPAMEKAPGKPRYAQVQKKHRKDRKAPEYREFDPNKADVPMLESMGVSRRVAQNWIKYLEKGGRFRNAEAVRRIYGMEEDVFFSLKPWMQFGEADAVKRTDLVHGNAPETQDKNGAEPAIRRKPCTPVDINRATEAEWDVLPGIGPVLAARIVRFRDRLGGFHRTAQIGETYGLPDSTFQRILPCLTIQTPYTPLDINKADENVLRNHPYIGYKLARLMIAYRDQHGAFQQVEDLLKFPVVDHAVYERLKPYVQIGPAEIPAF